MEVPLILQFAIALFTGMVLSTFIPPVRRTLTRPVEVGLWIGLATVCFLGVTRIVDPHARELTSSALWAAGRIFGNAFAGLMGGLAASIAAQRFVIALAVVLFVGADLLALVVIRSVREAQRNRPRVRLRDWIEVPLPVAQPVAARTAPVDALTRKIAAGLTWGAALVFTATVELAIWTRDVLLPRQGRRVVVAAEAGRAGSKAGLDALREMAAQLRFAAHAWYVGAGAPMLGGIGTSAAGALRGMRRAAEPAMAISDQVIDISVMLGGPIGWYAPLDVRSINEAEGEQDVAAQRPDRLAS